MTLFLLCVGSLAGNALCGVASNGVGTYTDERINALCDFLKGNNTITSLKYAGQLESHPPLIAFNALCPLMRSVDGHALPIDELRGIKPVEAINLSHKGLGVASGFIIAACIKENAVLKELKCAACPLHMHNSVNSL